MYENKPQTIGDLKTAITARIRAIPVEECARVIDSFVRRLQMCLQRQGGHLEHIFGENIKIGLLDLQTGSFVE